MRTSSRTLRISVALVTAGAGIIVADAVSASESAGPAAVSPGAANAPATVPAGKGARIASAMSAAPQKLSRKATIMDYPSSADGDLVLLRKGTNGWVCLPDDTNTPGPDPVCADKQSMTWFEAWLGHKAPHLSTPGLAYMLRGASDPSNSDPFATEPAEGEHWHTSAPHVMVFPTEKLPKGTYSSDPDNGGPWVMFPGTPYEHYMIPVAPAHGAGGEHMTSGGMGGMGGSGQAG